MKATPSQLVRADLAVTGVHLLATTASLLAGDTVKVWLVVVFAGLFLLGVLGCGAAFLIAVGRSRYEEVFLAGAFFLAGDVLDASHRRNLYALLGVQVLVGVLGASLAPFTPVAFSVLVPLIGLAFVALAGSICGVFAAKGDQ